MANWADSNFLFPKVVTGALFTNSVFVLREQITAFVKYKVKLKVLFLLDSFKLQWFAVFAIQHIFVP